MLSTIIKTRCSKSPQVRRSYMLLTADENGGIKWTDGKISSSCGCSISTVERLRQHFEEESFQTALYGKQQDPIADKVLDGRVEAKLVALRCSSDPPSGYRQCSLRLLADRMVALEYVEHISYESVRQLLKKMKSSLGKSEVG